MTKTDGNASIVDWRYAVRYRYSGRVLTYDALRDEVETEAAGLPAGQWLDGEFRFDPWLADSLLVGTVERIDDEDR